MIRPALLSVLVAAAGCGAPARSVDGYARDPALAARIVAACDAGRARTDCEAARRGLAETRRRERMAGYERAF